MKAGEDPGSLSFKTLDTDFPLCSNCLALVIGGTGSGKSYFTYNYVLPTYIEHFDVKWIMICSKTAACDATLQAALAKCRANVIIDSRIERLFDTAQLIRAQSMKVKFVERLIKAKNPKKELEVIKKEIVKMKTYPTMQNELRDLVSVLKTITDPENYFVTRKGEDAFGDIEGEKNARFEHTYIKKTQEQREKEYRKRKPEDEAKRWPMNDDSDKEKEIDDLLSSSSDNEDACIQVVNLENPVLTQIAVENKYDDSESDPEKAAIELSFGIIVHSDHKINKEESYRLILKRIRENLTNYLIAGVAVFGEDYQPIFIIVDDNAVSHELSNPNSQFTQLCLTRRHLHCNIVILVQGVTYINTSIRRNATSMHLLPTMSNEDLKLIEKRLPKGLINTELADRYLQNTQHGIRDQQMTHIFMATNPSMIVDGLPDSITQYKL